MPLYLVSVAGEIPLKSPRTRPRFVKRLIENIKDALERKNIKNYEIWTEDARLFIKTSKDAKDVLKRVFGIHSFADVVETHFKSLDDLAEKIKEFAKEKVKDKKFALRVHRVGNHEFTSLDVARIAGSLLKPFSSGVNLEKPDVEIFVEIRGERAYLFTDRTLGPQGLPIGVEGKALVLFSGGFDSPVAAWFAAKRGIKVDFLHFIITAPQSVYFTFKVAKYLAENWLFGYKPKFYVIDLTNITAYMMENVRRSYLQVVLRGIMYIIAARLAEKLKYDAIITGESIGQASSQTLKNLKVIEKAVSDKILVLRPLSTYDKEEIIKYSRKIGTYNLSESIREYCVMVQRHVTTRASLNVIKEELSKITADQIKKSLETMKSYDLLSLKSIDVMSITNLEIDFIPEEALIIDLRDYGKYKEWHVPGARHISEIDDFEKLRNKIIVLYCESGILSYLYAKKLRAEGIKAFSLKGGIKTATSISRKCLFI